MQQLEKFMADFAGAVWGLPLIILLFGTHLFLTFRLGFIQRFIGQMIRLSVKKDEGGQGDVSHFGALTTALAATIGTGNIFGVAGAVVIGGPGAVLWMWLTGVFGIATKYAEAVLSVKYRVTTDDGRTVGGPMYVLERGMNAKWLGMIFAGFTAIAAFGIGNMVQSNTLTGMIERVSANAEGVPAIPSWVVGVILAAATGAVILGGVKSIARVCEFLVPIMACIYVLGCLVILFLRASVLPDTIMEIIHGAFSGQAAIGGFAGAGMRAVIQAGIARGLFSNESGLGSAPIVAAAARTTNPVRQALVSASATFWDTVVICAITGLVIVSSGHWKSAGIAGKNALAEAAFGDLPIFGPFILTFGLMTFVFSTILGWSYYGERAAEYLFGTRVILPYRILWVIAVALPTFEAGKRTAFVWDFGDAMNGLMAVPNLISLIVLSGVIVAETKAHRGDLTGKE
ncbi:MAG: sodium:alanine symporter family protein [Chthoniobacteraceae bacterium]